MCRSVSSCLILSYLRHLADVSNHSREISGLIHTSLTSCASPALGVWVHFILHHLSSLEGHTQKKHRPKQKAARPSLRCSAPRCQEHYWSFSKPNWKPFSHCFCPPFACIPSGWPAGGECDTFFDGELTSLRLEMVKRVGKFDVTQCKLFAH